MDRASKTFKIIGAVISIGFLLTWGTASAINWWDEQTAPYTATIPETPQPTLDPRIAAIASRVGISTENLLKAHATVGTMPGNPPETEVSAYGPESDTIYIYPDLFNKPMDVQASIVSHEYLHWVYDTQNINKPKWCSALMSYYNNRPALKQRMHVYEKLGVGSLEFCDELHSVLGTETSDSSLNADLLDWYKKWLPNRNALPSYY